MMEELESRTEVDDGEEAWGKEDRDDMKWLTEKDGVASQGGV